MPMDPGTALAIASMAYDVTKDLYEFYRVWKDCENDVKEIRLSLLWTSNAFGVIRLTLQRPGFDDNAATTQSSTLIFASLGACSGQVNNLRIELDKIKLEGVPLTILEKLKAHGRRLTYPFRKATVGHLTDLLDDCREHLHLSVDLLSLNTGANSLQAIRQLDARLAAELVSIGDDLSDLSAKADKLLTDNEIEKHRRILDWLAPVDQSGIPVGKHEPGTNRWFLDGPEFAMWQKEAASLMWLFGGVGCGKSVLCSAILSSLRKSSPAAIVVSFWFSFTDTIHQKLDTLLRSIIAQICSYPAIVPLPLYELYDICHRSYPPAAPSTSQLQKTLVSLLGYLNDSADVYVVVDAIDEVPFGPDRTETVQAMQELASLRLSFLKLLFLSRPESDIKACLRESGAWRLVEVPQDAMNDDISRYISNEISRDARLRTLSSDTKARITDRLVGHESGMFRWAALQLEALKKTRVLAPRSIDKVLATLPKDLNATYARILESVDDEYSEEVINALQWLTLAFRPLYLEELVEACILRPNKRFEEAARLRPTDLLDLLSHLVTIEPAIDVLSGDMPRRSHRVTFAHFSVKEFLVKTSVVDPATAHRHVGNGCINYLCCNNSPGKIAQDYALLFYAWDYWALHAVAQDTGPCDNQKSAALQLFESIWYGDQSAIAALLPEPAQLTLVASMEALALPRHSVHSTLNATLGCANIVGTAQDTAARVSDYSALRIPYFYEEYDRSIPLDEGKFRHRPLETGWIRLLMLFPASDPFTKLRCSIIHVPLQDAPEYEAISWLWKGPLNTLLRVNGLAMTTPASLRANLLGLRAMQGDRHRLLWVDACCIQQDSDQDWLYQSPLMGKIIESAHEMSICVGEAINTDRKALNLLRELSHSLLTPTDVGNADLMPLRDVLRSFDGVDCFKSIRSLFERSWWRRTWVVQEFLLCRRCTLIYGDTTIEFEALEAVVRAENRAKEYLSRVSVASEFSAATLFSSEPWLRVSALIRTRLRLKSEPDWKPSLPEALRLTCDRLETIESDRYVALLAFISDGFAGQFPRTCEDFTEYIIRSYKTLDHFSYITIPTSYQDDPNNFPSWASDFKILAPSGRIPLVKGIFHGPDTVDIFAASGTTIPMFGKTLGPQTLVLQGLEIDRIAAVTISATSSWEDECPAESVQAFQTGRQCFSTGDSRSCLGPLDAEIGDTIVVLLGGKVPYVLRPVGKEQFRMVGECIVPGVMQGEMLEEDKQGKRGLRMFVIE